jgi:hypothetical protein
MCFKHSILTSAVSRAPSQLDVTNAKRDGLEIRSRALGSCRRSDVVVAVVGRSSCRLFTVNDWESTGAAGVAAGRVKRLNLLLYKAIQAPTGIAASALLVIPRSRVRAPPAPQHTAYDVG